jgi:exonuclease III
MTSQGFSSLLTHGRIGTPNMRIATWNLKHDAGACTWPTLIDDFGADILFLQETRLPRSNSFVLWQKVPHHDRGSAVICSSGKVLPVSIPNYDGWVVGGELVESQWNRPSTPLFLFSLHSPSANAQSPRCTYVEEVAIIVRTLKSLLPSGADLILGGDFNFLSLGERHPSEPLKTKPEERDCLKLLSDLGLVSCWTEAHPNKPLAQTLRWSGDRSEGKTTPYHCDGIFVPKAWGINACCEVLTSKPFEVSDHFPVFAWIPERHTQGTSL